MTREFTDELLKAEFWISKVLMASDKLFYQWLKGIFAEDGIYMKFFLTSFQFNTSLCFGSMLTLCGEAWVDSDALDSIMAFYTRCYGSRGEVVFLDASNYKTTASGIDINERTRRVFACVNMGRHWGALGFDLENHTIFFGDSMKRTFPMKDIETLMTFVTESKGYVNGIEGDKSRGAKKRMSEDKKKWKQALKTVTRMDVPPQKDSGSCGVLGVIAIERAVNGHFDWDAEPAYTSAEYHRIRFLRLCTGYVQVNMHFLSILMVMKSKLLCLSAANICVSM